MVPPFDTAHTFCASRDKLRNLVFFRIVRTNTKVFLCSIKTMWEKHVLAKAVGVRKENWQ